jgi:hypothetical protein
MDMAINLMKSGVPMDEVPIHNNEELSQMLKKLNPQANNISQEQDHILSRMRHKFENGGPQ